MSRCVSRMKCNRNVLSVYILSVFSSHSLTTHTVYFYLSMVLRGCPMKALLNLFPTLSTTIRVGILYCGFNDLFLNDLNITQHSNPAGNYMFKVSNRNTRTRCEICSKLTVKTPERCHCRRSGFFIVNFEYISHLALVFLLLTLSM